MDASEMANVCRRSGLKLSVPAAASRLVVSLQRCTVVCLVHWMSPIATAHGAHLVVFVVMVVGTQVAMVVLVLGRQPPPLHDPLDLREALQLALVVAHMQAVLQAANSSSAVPAGCFQGSTAELALWQQRVA
jgi:hypothetical protein